MSKALFTLAPAHRHWPLLVSKLAKDLGNSDIFNRYGIICIKHCAARARIPNGLKLHWVCFYLSSKAPQDTSLLKAPKAHCCALQTGFENLSPGHAEWQNACHAQIACSFCASLLRTLLLQHQNLLLPGAAAL